MPAVAMNYRHEFHAGNFADVLKHAALTRALLYLRRKDKPFRIIDTHAGAGLYDLAGAEAARSNEARDGIVRLLDAAEPDSGSGAAADLLAPYLDAVRAGGRAEILSRLAADRPGADAAAGPRRLLRIAAAGRARRCAGRWAATSASRPSRSTAISA